METNNQKESFEVLELVLKNLVEEQQKVCRTVAEEAVVLELIANKLDIFMEQVQQIKTDAPQVNLQPIEDLIRRNIEAREVREREHPQTVIRQW